MSVKSCEKLEKSMVELTVEVNEKPSLLTSCNSTFG